MRVTSVDMYSANLEEAITFGLADVAQDSEYEVRTIIGLDAEDIVPKFYSKSIDGSQNFYNFSLKPRDIILRVLLNPRFDRGDSYSDVRDRLYRTISANRTGLVTLHFNAGGTLVAMIKGSIVKFEALHFAKKPEVQITINCKDPMFKAINAVNFEPDEIATTNPISVPDSLSSAPHGFTMKATFTGATDSWTVQDDAITPTWAFEVAPSGGFLLGDELYFSSEYSDKQIYLYRDPDIIQLADKIVPGSVWPVIFPGSNSFHFVDLASFDFDYIKYYAAYWGV